MGTNSAEQLLEKQRIVPMCKTCRPIELYRTAAGCVSQCDRENRILVDFGGHVACYRIDTFRKLKKTVDAIDLQAMAQNADRAADFALVSVFGCERFYVLSLTQVVAFRELLDGAKFMLELNSVLHECLSGNALA